MTGVIENSLPAIIVPPDVSSSQISTFISQDEAKYFINETKNIQINWTCGH